MSAKAVTEPQELVYQGPLSIARPPEVVLKEAIQAAECLKALLDAQPDQVILNGKRYLKFEDWQTVARFYGVTVRVTNSKPIRFQIGEQEVIGFTAIADALLVANGQVISSAESMCLNDEPRWRSRPKYEYQNGRRKRPGDDPVPLFQLRSMAQTRACAKALRNVMAWVVVLAGYCPTPAEEMQDVEPELAKGNCSECGWEIFSAPEIADSRREFAKTLCKVCIKHEREKNLSKTVTDPEFVKKSVEQVKAKQVQVVNGRVQTNAH